MERRAWKVCAQGGMKARDAALLGGLPVMEDLVGLPFAPQVIWLVDEGPWIGLRLGDLRVATAFLVIWPPGPPEPPGCF